MNAVPTAATAPPPDPQPSPSAPVLEVRGLGVDYGVGPDTVHAVVDADLVLHPGEVLGLAGESGSGKSTLAYAVTRLLRAPGVITAGEAVFHGTRTVDLLAAGERELRTLRWSEIAVVFQSAMNALNPVMSVGAQLGDVLKAHRPDLSRAQRRERCAELLRMVGITPDRLRSHPHELSGGQRQRVMIGMALALQPRVVIMDEPTTALDVVTQREILEELIGLRDRLGFAVLFITHDLSLLVELADAIAVMYAGRVVERAAAADLFHAPRHPYTLGLLGSFPSLHGPRRTMTGIPGSPPDLRNRPTGCAFRARCPYALPRCERDDPPLSPLGSDGGADGARARWAACWLQEEGHPTPTELGRGAPLGGVGAGALGDAAAVWSARVEGAGVAADAGEMADAGASAAATASSVESAAPLTQPPPAQGGDPNTHCQPDDPPSGSTSAEPVDNPCGKPGSEHPGQDLDASANDASANDASANDASANDASANDASANDASANDASANDAPDTSAHEALDAGGHP